MKCGTLDLTGGGAVEREGPREDGAFQVAWLLEGWDHHIRGDMRGPSASEGGAIRRAGLLKGGAIRSTEPSEMVGPLEGWGKLDGGAIRGMETTGGGATRKCRGLN